MKTVNKKAIAVIMILAAVSLMSGCTNWQQKYDDLNVVHENLKGRYDLAVQRSQSLEAENKASAQTINDLQRQIEEGKSQAEATGFDGMDVNVDSAAGTITVTLSNSILFDSGKATLKKGTISELDHVSSVIQSKYPGKEISVVGHTDTDPIKKSSWKDNWELSAQRSLSVVRYMVKNGISSDKIKAVGCGEARPIGSNSSVSGKAKNRRVEIVVHMR